MSLKDRLAKLEKRAKDREPKQVWFIVRYDRQPELSEEELEQERAEYKRGHPDWQTRVFNVIYPEG